MPGKWSQYQFLCGSTKFWTVHQWNFQLREAVNRNHAHEALHLFRQMKQNSFQPNHLTFPVISKACAKLYNLKCSQMVHTHVVKSPFWPDVFVQTAMVDMYVKCQRLDYAHNLFERMPRRDVASWNVMLGGFAHLGLLDKVLGFFRDMRFSGVRPDSLTVIEVSRAVSCVEDLNLVKGIHSFGIRIGISGDLSIANTWIAAYAKCGDLSLSGLVFHGIKEGLRSIVSWNSMIEGYANIGNFLNTIKLYKSMLCGGFRPDISTILSLLSSCVQPEALLQGSLIHSHGIHFGCNSDISVINTLISMYCKCGDIDSARYLFECMLDRTCVTWTIMISGYAEKGNMAEALTLFNSMEASDLLGRRGKLNDALEFLQKMPVKPDVAMWSALLSACKIYHNVEIGECAAQHLFELEPDEAAPYVEMANIYASAGMWDRVARTRMMMKSYKMRKSPGQSLVQVNGVSHAFMVEERSHPDCVPIFATLDSLKLQSEKRSLLYMDGMLELELESSHRV